MSSPRLWTGSLLLALLLSTGFSGVAIAQVAGTGGSVTGTGGIRVAVTTVDGVSRDEKGPVYINLAECEANVIVEFRLDGAPMNKPVIDVYRGAGNCNASGRTDAAENACTFVGTGPGRVSVDHRIQVAAQDMIPGECSDHYEGVPKLWFLPVSETMSAEAVTVYGVNEQIFSDNRAPAAPTDVDAGGGGENVITISWSSDSQVDTDLERFIAYIDPAPGDGELLDQVQDAIDGGPDVTLGNPECPSAHLIPGENPEDLPSQIIVEPLDNENQRSYQLKPKELGLENTTAAVAIRAEDKAGNLSPLSEVTCAHVIPTTDFWESYLQGGGDESVEGCPCSTVGRTQLESGWPVAVSLLLMGVSARRRRRGDRPRGRVA